MTDKGKIIEELRKNIINVKEQKLLHSICDEIFEIYDKRSAKAVSKLLQGKINPLKSKFDNVHNRLLKKMGL
ncbi:hypothetical protein LR066_01850 [candidate division WOR-3 bacterium]|nr:hypothetical protein [candidate division WOR-3 bacterium]